VEPKIVADLMSSNVATLDQNDELELADDIMKLGRIRHLPVIGEGGVLVGIVSQRDLYYSALVKALGHGTRAVGKTLHALRVKDVMQANPSTVLPSTPIADAARLMSKHKVGCLPVVEDGRLVGILTEGDFVAHFASS
jgi:CBS domain-containing protein